MSSITENLTEKELKSKMLQKLKFKSVIDVSMHELNSLKEKRAVYLKKGRAFFLSSKEEALKTLAPRKNEEKA